MLSTYTALANLAGLTKERNHGGTPRSVCKFKANQYSSLYKGRGKPELLATHCLPKAVNLGRWGHRLDNCVALHGNRLSKTRTIPWRVQTAFQTCYLLSQASFGPEHPLRPRTRLLAICGLAQLLTCQATLGKHSPL